MDYKTEQIKSFKKKIIIGTAQLLSDYGITNSTQQKKRKEEAEKIIAYCIKKNLNKFDTAISYENEKFISNLIFKSGNRQFKPVFTTKISALESYKDSRKFYKIEKSIEKSLKNLNEINTILFHDQKDIKFTIKNIDRFKTLVFNLFESHNF